MDGGYVHGPEAVREYWTRQWTMVSPQVEPVGFQPVRLPLERFAFEIADGLPDFCDDRALRSVSIRQTEPTRE